MEAERSKEVIAGMVAATKAIANPVSDFARAMEKLDIRIGVHNYVDDHGDPVLLVVARGDRAAEVEAACDKIVSDGWVADSHG